MPSTQKVCVSGAVQPSSAQPSFPALSPPLRGTSSLRVSLHLQTQSGHIVRQGHAAQAALRGARAVIRQAGFTILQAHAAFEAPGYFAQEWGFEKQQEMAATWRKACAAAQNIWHRMAPENCPRFPALRLVVAVRAAPKA